jgi:hypothetical protein
MDRKDRYGGLLFVTERQVGECKNTDMTKKEIKQAVEKLEKVTGIECLNYRRLRKTAPLEMLYEAWESDRLWFRGLADTIYDNT